MFVVKFYSITEANASSAGPLSFVVAEVQPPSLD